jgi:sugar lactone lactonase YvrE
VYRYNPTTRETHLLATGFFYSNGIAVSADDTYLVISETDRLRLVKYWLKGPKVGWGVQGLIDLMRQRHEQ